MSKLPREAFRVSVWIATLIIGLQNLLMKYWKSIDTVLPDHWGSLVVAAAVSGLLYKSIMYIYQKYAWRLFYRDLVLSGKWTHTIRPCDENPNGDRNGNFEIVQDTFGTKIIGGENYNEFTGKVSRWHSLAIVDHAIHERQIIILYEIERSSSSSHTPDASQQPADAKIDRGVIHAYLELDLKSGGVIRMKGRYSDCGNQHYGEFLAVRFDHQSQLKNIGQKDNDFLALPTTSPADS